MQTYILPPGGLFCLPGACRASGCVGARHAGGSPPGEGAASVGGLRADKPLPPPRTLRNAGKAQSILAVRPTPVAGVRTSGQSSAAPANRAQPGRGDGDPRQARKIRGNAKSFY